MTEAATPAALASVDLIINTLAGVGYIADRQIATAIHLARNLQKPVLIEGPAGVGKTDLARSLASAMNYPLIRLQCYEGVDESKAIYEWKYGKQLLYTQILKDKISDVLQGAETLDASLERLSQFQDVFFSREFLEARPLLHAMEQDDGSVLLIDEVDKSDEEFEALLLEILSDYQVTVPEIGTIEARVAPLVILTSNNARELGDALKRRCLHLYIGFPDAEREGDIVRSRVPDINDKLLTQLVSFVQALRGEDLRKLPSISETIDWARTLVLMHADTLQPQMVQDTLNVLLKHQADVRHAEQQLDRLVRESTSNAA